jgi:hypothetical protein
LAASENLEENATTLSRRVQKTSSFCKSAEVAKAAKAATLQSWPTRTKGDGNRPRDARGGSASLAERFVSVAFIEPCAEKEPSCLAES